MWQLALPIMAGLVGQTLIGIADTVMVGAVGVEALAAASLVVNLFHLPLVFGFGMLSSISVHASHAYGCLLYTSPSPRDQRGSRMPSSA